jgi:hypothetical protein
VKGRARQLGEQWLGRYDLDLGVRERAHRLDVATAIGRNPAIYNSELFG